MSSAVVLLSAGLDSAFNLYRAAKTLEIKLALTFDYGQRAAPNELTRSAELAGRLGVPHRIVDVRWFDKFTKTSLLSDAPVPTGDDVAIDDLAKSTGSAARVWVPNRNGIFLNIAAGFAEGLRADYVIAGFNREEAATFPDNSAGFLKALDACWTLSTATGVRTLCYSAELDKTEIVERSRALNLPFARLWPCYLAGERWCGTCESCLRFKRAVEANGMDFDAL